MGPTYTVEELATTVGGTLRGDGASVIVEVADLAEAGPDQASWVSRPRYIKQVKASHAGVVLVPADFPASPMPAILCDHINLSIAKLLAAFAPPVSQPDPGVHPTAVVHPTARIGADPSIGPHVVIDADAQVGASCIIHAGVFIGRDTIVGDNCLLWPNVVIRDGCTVGNGVTVHANAVIGADGFGFYFDEGRHCKVPHIGGVIIEDGVEIGACSCIDRSKFGNTVIGRGTIIDNLVQVGHNVLVGSNCVFAGQSGVAGSVRIGAGSMFGGQAGVIDNLSIGSGAQFGAGCLVTKDFPEGITATGSPAQELSRELRSQAMYRRLPDLGAKIKDLIARVERLETAADDNP